jgi:hypothetical protein
MARGASFGDVSIRASRLSDLRQKIGDVNTINRAALIVSIAVFGLAACGSDTKSPAPAGTQVMTPTSEAMMTPTTEAMTTPTSEVMMPATTAAMMGDASTTTTGG